MPRKIKAFICSHFPFQVTVGKQRQFLTRSPCCTYSVSTLCPQRCLSSAGAYSEISRCCFRHDTAFDKVCNTALKRALALFSNFSFSCDLEEIWIYRFLKTHTHTCAHMHTCTNTQYPYTQLECSWRTAAYTGKLVLVEGARCSEPPDSAIWIDLLCQSLLKLTADLVWNPDPQVYRKTQQG